MQITHEIQHGAIKLYVTAPAGTHHSTIAAAALKYVRALTQPNYVSTVTVTKPGVWCVPMYAGPWKRVGSDLQPDTHIRKTFAAWPVPANTLTTK